MSQYQWSTVYTDTPQKKTLSSLSNKVRKQYIYAKIIYFSPNLCAVIQKSCAMCLTISPTCFNIQA